MTGEETTRVGWAELLAHPQVREEATLGEPVGIMAFHGGLEAGTAEIARHAADRSGASLYVVEQPPSLRWHVPSHFVDPDRSMRLRDWLRHVDVAIALHGYGGVRRPRRVLLGGTNRDLAGRLAGHLRRTLPDMDVVTELGDIPPELRGLHPDNPVNRAAGGGVQVELPPSARDRRLGGDAPKLVGDALSDLVTGYLDTGYKRRS